MKKFLSLFALIAACAVPASAQVVATWNQDANASWNVNGNWNYTTGSTFPNGVGDTASLTNNITTTSRTISLSQLITVGTLNIGDSDSTHAFILQNGTGGSLVLDNTGSTNAVISKTSTTTDQITASVQLNDNLDMSVVAGTLQITGGAWTVDSGTKTITKTGAGTLEVRTSALSNSFAIQLNGGTLATGNGGVNSNITIGANGVTLRAGGSGILSGQISGSGDFIASGGSSSDYLRLSNTANNFTGNITVTNDRNLGLNASGVITDTSVVTMNLGSTLRMNGQTETIGGLSAAGATASVSNLNSSNNTGNAAAASLTLNLASSTTQTYNGIIQNGTGAAALSLTKTGLGTQVLGGNLSYTGSTTVNQGILRLSSTATNLSSTTIGFGVTDTASGQLDILNTAFSFNGTLSLGLATVTVNNAIWNLFTGSQFVASDLSLSGVTTNLVGLSFTQNGSLWEGTDSSSREWTFNQSTGVLSVIPEPSTYLLLTASLLWIVIMRRRRVVVS